MLPKGLKNILVAKENRNKVSMKLTRIEYIFSKMPHKFGANFFVYWSGTKVTWFMAKLV